MAGVDNIVEKLCAELSDAREPRPIDDAFAVNGLCEKFCDVDRAEIARIIEMQLLFAARVARVDRAHRRHHVVVTVDLVDKDDAGLGVFVSGRDDAVPDVGCKDHAGHRRFFDGAVRKIGRFECKFVGKSRGRTVGTAINDVIRTGYRVENGLRPRLALKLGLKPRAAVDRVHKQVRHGHRDIKICQARLIVLGVDEPQNIGMRDAQECPYSHRGGRRPALRPRSSD